MVRKSVVIGFGLWLVAVASVASIAWIAINSAARPVTALSVSGDPTPASSDPFTSVPVVPSLPSSASTSAPATSTPGVAATAADAGTDADAGQVAAVFGTYSTEGGRVRAQCTDQRASLDGGYARPEPGWMVRVVSDEARVLVVFGSQVKAIEVLAHCEDGGPSFQQQSQSVPLGGTVPDPAQTPTAQPQSSRTAAFAPTRTWTARAQPAPSASTSASTTSPDRSRFGVTADGEATPSTGTDDGSWISPVERYVHAQDDLCAQAGTESPWCQQWTALPVGDRYALVWSWLNPRHPTSTGHHRHS